MSTQYSLLFKQEQAHDDAIWSVGWGKNANDGSELVISGSLDDLVKVWKWADERLELQWSLEGHQLGVVSVDVSASGNILASSSLDAHIRLWDLDSGKQIRSIDAGPVDAWSVAFSPDSQHLATGSHVGKVNIFGVETGKKEFSLDTRGKFILSNAYSPDGKYLASGAIDGIINIFDIATGKLLHTLEGHAMPIRSLTFSPDSQLLVTASDDGYIKIYDVQHASLAATLSGHGSWVLNVAFSPDDAHFVSSSSDKSVKVWDVATRTCVHTFLDHQDQYHENWWWTGIVPWGRLSETESKICRKKRMMDISEPESSHRNPGSDEPDVMCRKQDAGNIRNTHNKEGSGNDV
uniref:Superkiller complex protein 8 n=1 Tax=Leptobrachium leishanense TaxID=445787 RepID=A0A8C5MD22_9ANUR